MPGGPSRRSPLPAARPGGAVPYLGPVARVLTSTGSSAPRLTRRHAGWASVFCERCGGSRAPAVAPSEGGDVALLTTCPRRAGGRRSHRTIVEVSLTSRGHAGDGPARRIRVAFACRRLIRASPTAPAGSGAPYLPRPQVVGVAVREDVQREAAHGERAAVGGHGEQPGRRRDRRPRTTPRPVTVTTSSGETRDRGCDVHVGAPLHIRVLDAPWPWERLSSTGRPVHRSCTWLPSGRRVGMPFSARPRCAAAGLVLAAALLLPAALVAAGWAGAPAARHPAGTPRPSPPAGAVYKDLAYGTDSRGAEAGPLLAVAGGRRTPSSSPSTGAGPSAATNPTGRQPVLEALKRGSPWS